MSNETKLIGKTEMLFVGSPKGKQATQEMINYLQEQLDDESTQAMSITAIVAKEQTQVAVVRSEYTRLTNHGHVTGASTTFGEEATKGVNLWVYDIMVDNTYCGGEANAEEGYFAYCAGPHDETVIVIRDEEGVKV